MPTNLPPEYFDVERRYREAETTEERIALLEELLGAIPKHKGTEKLRGDYKSRLAKLRQIAQSHKGKSHHASAFHIKREGVGQAILIGCSNTGKSSLLQALTHAEPEISDSSYTTWDPMPGMMEKDTIQVQLIDTPPLDAPFVEPELFSLIRRSDLILLVIDLQGDPFQQLEDSTRLLEAHRIEPVSSLNPLSVSEEAHCTPIPTLLLANKCDRSEDDRECQAFCDLIEKKYWILPVSAHTGRNLDRLKQELINRLRIIRVYAKPPGKEVDLEAPFVLREGSTLEELGGRIHKDFVRNLQFARVWGHAVRDGQMVSRDYVLQDGDIVEFHL